MILALFLLAPVAVLAEPMLYMFPTNPQLHPSQMYPNQQFMRGKVRDLPNSGVIYLNRIKPIDKEFQKSAEEGTEVQIPLETIPRQHEAPSSFERYNSEEERSPVRKPSDKAYPAPFEAFPAPKIHAEERKQKEALSVPEQAELDILLGDLMKNEKKQEVAKIPKKIGRSSTRHAGAHTPKLISFDGTARVDRPKARASPISVRLQPRKLYAEGSSSVRTNQGADFDPWERMGQ